MPKLIHVHTTDVGKHHPFEVTPYPLCGVEVRRVRGQYPQLDTFDTSPQEPFSHLLSSMDCGSIPHHSHQPCYRGAHSIQARRSIFPPNVSTLRRKLIVPS